MVQCISNGRVITGLVLWTASLVLAAGSAARVSSYRIHLPQTPALHRLSHSLTPSSVLFKLTQSMMLCFVRVDFYSVVLSYSTATN